MTIAAPKTRRRGRPPADAAQTSLTKDRIIEAALEQLALSGLAGFTIRDVAARLGVSHGAVLWHVGTRNGLLGDVVAQVLRDLQPDPRPETWQDWFRELFRRYREAIQRHPAVAPLIGAQMVSNAHVDQSLIETELSILSEAGFSGERLIEAYNLVTAAQVGFVTLEFAPPPPDNPEQWSKDMQRIVHDVDPRQHPLLAAYVGQMANRSFTLRWQNGAEVPLDRSFEAYVDAIIYGLESLASNKSS